MPLKLPIRFSKPPVKGKSETGRELAARKKETKCEMRTMSNKDVAVAYLTVLLQDAAKNASDLKLDMIVGGPMRGGRHDKVREFVQKYAEKYMRSGKKLLEKHSLQAALNISFVSTTHITEDADQEVVVDETEG